MRIEKQIRGSDGILRSWVWDSDSNFIGYSGIASDFKDKLFTIGIKEVVENNILFAQDIIDHCD